MRQRVALDPDPALRQRALAGVRIGRLDEGQELLGDVLVDVVGHAVGEEVAAHRPLHGVPVPADAPGRAGDQGYFTFQVSHIVVSLNRFKVVR